tara:strand:- start:10807 stop:11637 length:831 start_codon:yes stop_codon:yes gene_type:complete
MGVNLHSLNFLLLNSKRREFGKTLTLGKLKIYVDEFNIKKILNDKNYKKQKYIDEVLINYFGSTQVDVLDINDYEGANIIHDLNIKIPEKLEDKYDTILDFGTLEHIFDVKTAIENISLMSKKNGMILHVSPTNNFCGHGFYQFSPEFFNTVYSLNKSYKNTEIFLSNTYDSKNWYKLKEFNNKRINVQSDQETYVLCKTIIVNKNISNQLQQSDYKEKYKERKNINDIKNNNFNIRKLFIMLNNFFHFWVNYTILLGKKMIDALFTLKIIKNYKS